MAEGMIPKRIVDAYAESRGAIVTDVPESILRLMFGLGAQWGIALSSACTAKMIKDMAFEKDPKKAAKVMEDMADEQLALSAERDVFNKETTALIEKDGGDIEWMNKLH